MRISYTTVDLSRRFGEAGAIRALAAAGFDAFDMAFMDLSSPMFGEGWRQHTAHLAETARRAGIVCNQAHAPYPTHRAETEENRPYNDRILDHVLRSMEAAAMLGAPCIVVHPWHHRPYAENAEVLFSENMEFYRSLAPYAKAFGIRIAIENMWQRRDGRSGPIVDSVCAPPKELARYLDALGTVFSRPVWIWGTAACAATTARRRSARWAVGWGRCTCTTTTGSRTGTCCRERAGRIGSPFCRP